MCNELTTEQDILRRGHELGMHKVPVAQCETCYAVALKGFLQICELVLLSSGFEHKLDALREHMTKLTKTKNWQLLDDHHGWFVANFLHLDHSSPEYYHVIFQAHPTNIEKLLKGNK